MQFQHRYFLNTQLIQTKRKASVWDHSLLLVSCKRERSVVLYLATYGRVKRITYPVKDNIIYIYKDMFNV